MRSWNISILYSAQIDNVNNSDNHAVGVLGQNFGGFNGMETQIVSCSGDNESHAEEEGRRLDDLEIDIMHPSGWKR